MRLTSNLRVHSKPEPKKPPKIRITVKQSERVPALSDTLPPHEAAIVVALDRMGRPVTPGELSWLALDVQRISRADRDIAIQALVRRKVLERRTFFRPHPLISDSCRVSASLTFVGFPEQFAEMELDADGR